MQGIVALDQSVLVLNRFYAAINVITARKAFNLLFKEAAEVVAHDEEEKYTNYDISDWMELSALRKDFDEVENEEDDWVRTTSVELRVPRIIRLLVYDRLPEKTVKFNRRHIFARDDGKCQYCGKKFPYKELTLDHVIPRSQGGKMCWENIVCSCIDCNTRKGGRTPEQARMKLIKLPVKPVRSPIVKVKIQSEKYRSWRSFVTEAYWGVTLKEDEEK